MNITRLRPIKSTTAIPASSTKGKRFADVEKIRVSSEASTLLAEVLARLHAIELPILQFMPACPSGGGDHVACEFAIAAVARFGRTLLLDARTKSSACRDGSRKQRRPFAATPDGDVPGLYHRRGSDVLLESIVTEMPANRPFRMIIVQSAIPSACPSGLQLARHCHGSVLTVAAGVTRLTELEASARQLRHAGGTVLGTVLFNARNIDTFFGSCRAA